MRKYIIITIVFIMAIGVYIGVNHNSKANEEPYITLIPDTEESDSEVYCYTEYYIIANPPKDLKELKELIKKYNSENQVDLQKFKERLEKHNSENLILQQLEDGKVPKRYLRVFLGETKYTPRDWKPKGHSDIIDDHVDDIIAKVSWSNDDIKKRYVLWEMEDYKIFEEKKNRKTIDEIMVTE